MGGGGFGGGFGGEAANDAAAGAEGSNAANQGVSGVSSNAEAQGGIAGMMGGLAGAIGNVAANPGVTDIGSFMGGIPGAVAMGGLSGIAEGIGAMTGRATEGLGGVPSTDGAVGDGVSGGGAPAAPGPVAAPDVDGDDGGTGSTPAFPTGWNEATFLAANPDVAASVQDGTWESGYAFNRAWKKFAGQDYGTAPAGSQARNAYAYQDDFMSTGRGDAMPYRGYFPDHRGPYG